MSTTTSPRRVYRRSAASVVLIAADVKQRELAEHLRVTPSYVSQILGGQLPPTVKFYEGVRDIAGEEVANRLAAALAKGRR